MVQALVHIGANKAGSTSLQDTLSASRSALLRRGVLVPFLGKRSLTPNEVHALFCDPEPTARTQEIARAIDREVKHHKPEFIVFSSEYLFQDTRAAAQLLSRLPRWSSDCRLVLYLREPASYYLSLQQQGLRAVDYIEDARTWTTGYRDLVASWRSALENRLTIVPFQRSTVGANPALDFLSRAAPQANVRASDFVEVESNVGDPAEVTSAMQEYHCLFHPGEPRQFRPKAKLIREALLEASRITGRGERARLRPEVRQLVFYRHRDELQWLRDTEGLVFDAVDYDELATMAPPQVQLPSGATYLDIIETQPSDVEALKFETIAVLAADIKARRSRLAYFIDKLDYMAHRLIASLPFLSSRYRAGMRGAAERRYRPAYRKPQ